MKAKTNAKIDRGFFSGLRGFSYFSCGLTLVALVAVIIFVVVRGISNIDTQLLFGEYESVSNPSIVPAFLGTIWLILISMAIAVPFGVFTAIFLVEYMRGKGGIVKIIRVATETLAGIPSIVYGLFGYLIFVRSFGWGYSMWGGGITLAIMILPTIVRSTEESLLSVPDGYREGSYALGASKVRTIFKVILPAASGGIVTAIILAIGRVVSESAVLILTIGMAMGNFSFSGAGTTLALAVYYFANNGNPGAAAATALVLLVFVLALNFLAAFLGKMIKRKYGEN